MGELSPIQVNDYFTTLDSRLIAVPELHASLELATSRPEFAASVYMGHVALVSHMAEITDDERQIIRAAKESMLNNHGNFGTASEVSADDLLTELGDHKGILAELAASSADPDSPSYNLAMDELIRRLEDGHQLKLSGKQPSDDDPESRKVIWGHTIITDPEALVYFMVAHYMERYFADALAKKGSRLALEKDFLLNALIDVVLVDSLSADTFGAIRKWWSDPKDQGGLGWITNDRVNSYSREGSR